MAQETTPKEVGPLGFDPAGWPLPEARSMMVENFAKSWQHHWLAAVVIFAVTLGLVAFGAWLVTPTWEGIAKIQVINQPLPDLSIGTGGTETAAENPKPEVMVKNIVEAINTRTLLAKVIEETGAADYFRMRAEEKPSLRTRIKDGITYIAKLKFIFGSADVNWNIKAMENLQEDWVVVAPLEGTTTVPIFIYGDTADMTIKVGDSIIRQLQDQMDDAVRQQVERRKKSLDILVESARNRVADSEKAVRDYRMTLPYFDPALYAQSALESLNTLQQQRLTIDNDIARAEANVSNLHGELVKLDPVLTLTNESSSEAPLQRTSEKIATDLAQLRVDRERELLRYMPASPQIRSLDSQIKSLEGEYQKAIAAEQTVKRGGEGENQSPNQLYNSVYASWLDARGTVAALNIRKTVLDGVIAELQKNQQDAINADEELKKLERAAQREEDRYSLLLRRQSDFQSMLDQVGADGGRLYQSIFQTFPTTVKNPNDNDYPSMLLIGVIGVAIAFFMALVIPVAYDYMNQTLLSSRQASTIPGLRLSSVAARF